MSNELRRVTEERNKAENALKEIADMRMPCPIETNFNYSVVVRKMKNIANEVLEGDV